MQARYRRNTGLYAVNAHTFTDLVLSKLPPEIRAIADQFKDLLIPISNDLLTAERQRRRSLGIEAGAYPELAVEYKRAQKLGKYLAEVARLRGYTYRGDGWEDGFDAVPVSNAVESTWQEIGSLQQSGLKLTITSRDDENVYIDVPGVGLIYVKVPDPHSFDLSDPGAQFREPDPAEALEAQIPVGTSGLTADEKEAQNLYNAIQRGDPTLVSNDAGASLTSGGKRSILALAKRLDPTSEKIHNYFAVIAMRKDYDKPVKVLTRRASAAARWPRPTNRLVMPVYFEILRALDSKTQQTPDSITLGEIEKIHCKVKKSTTYLLNYFAELARLGLISEAAASKVWDIAQGDTIDPDRTLGSFKDPKAAGPVSRSDDTEDAYVAQGWPRGWDKSTKYARRLLIARVSRLSDLNESRLETAMESESQGTRQAIVDYLDGIAGEPGVPVTPALVTLAQQIAADFDAAASGGPRG